MEPLKPLPGMKPMEPLDLGEPWWPPALGQPSTSGAQNDVRYAYFAEAGRLLIEENGALVTYDTGAHRISGVSQAQSHGRSLTFASQNGPVKLDDLKRV